MHRQKLPHSELKAQKLAVLIEKTGCRGRLSAQASAVQERKKCEQLRAEIQAFKSLSRLLILILLFSSSRFVTRHMKGAVQPSWPK